MISPYTIGIKKSNHAALTLREFVEHHPEQISEVWCRKLLRHLLHALERQYALHLPHRAVTPDTVCFDESGTPRLQASFVSDARSDIADDLTALARVVHYAITREIVPARPLRGRGLAGYSDSIVTAIDRSLAADPARRPHSIGELRDLLGIVVCPRLPASAAPVPGMQAYAPEALAPRMARAPPRPARKWRRILAWAGGGLVTLALVGMAWFAVLHRSPTVDLPVPVPALAQSRDAFHAPPAQAPRAAASPLPEPALSAASDATVVAGATRAEGGSLAAAEGGRQVDPNGASTAAGAAPAPGRRARARDSRRRAASAAWAPAATAMASTASTPLATVASTAASGVSTVSASATPPASSPAPASSATPAPVPAASEDAASIPAAMPSDPGNEAAARATRPAATRSPGAASATVFALQIRPWGVLYVDGVRRGVSPPIKQLILAPGRHAILVTNPGSRDRTLNVDTARGDRRIAVDFDGGPP